MGAFLVANSVPLASIIVTGLIAILAPKIAGSQARDTAKQTHDLQEQAASRMRREERRAETYADLAKLMQDYGKFLSDQHRGVIQFDENPDHLHNTALDARVALFGSEELRNLMRKWIKNYSYAGRMSREMIKSLSEGGDRAAALQQLRDEALESSRSIANEIIEVMRCEVGTSEYTAQPPGTTDQVEDDES